MLFVVPGIIRQRVVSEGGRRALSAVAIVSTRNCTRADTHRGSSSRRGAVEWQCGGACVRSSGSYGRMDGRRVTRRGEAS